ncbi:tetratricopeptide repeat protein [Marinicella gelatinilytica]|uniref:tetratricopeptide repeat protein n=1 Tax=Marinicella gelatinilytica TaxID=2996017 RepID=UPI002260A339|nr:tetratricopeptide repeat protein [Marinicella gelatinilytica]MCX7545268.1 tetratricopeptide repeat protein [Marinicella gelatinilytica]
MNKLFKVTGLIIVVLMLSHCSQRQNSSKAEVKDLSEQPRITSQNQAPNSVRPLLEQADQALSQGQSSQAINYLQRALQISPATAEIQQRLAEAYLAEGRYQQAAYWADIVINTGPKTEPLCSQSRQTLALAAEAMGDINVQTRALAALNDCQ